MTYGCKNHPRVNGTYPAQSGWVYDKSGTTRTPKIIYIKNRATIPCQYSKHRDDRDCHGCDHNQQGRQQCPVGE